MSVVIPMITPAYAKDRFVFVVHAARRRYRELSKKKMYTTSLMIRIEYRIMYGHTRMVRPASKLRLYRMLKNRCAIRKVRLAIPLRSRKCTANIVAALVLSSVYTMARNAGYPGG